MWSCTRCDYDVCRRCASKLVEAAPEEEREVREYRIEEEACRPCTSAAYTSAVGGHGGGGGGGGCGGGGGGGCGGGGGGGGRILHLYDLCQRFLSALFFYLRSSESYHREGSV